ncbi:MAG: hypothetical protein ACLSX5_11270 [Lachnospiraceae bacterium]
MQQPSDWDALEVQVFTEAEHWAADCTAVWAAVWTAWVVCAVPAEYPAANPLL